MTDTTVLVSHWKDVHENDGQQEGLPHCPSVKEHTVPDPTIEVGKNTNIKKKISISAGEISRQLILKIEWRKNVIRKNFLNDFFFGGAFIYPIKGLIEILTHKIYWKQIGVFSLSYSAIFIIIGTLYYVTIFTALLAWAVLTLGPLGFILAHIQWILQTNALTAIVCRKIILTYIRNQIFDTTLYLHGQRKFLRNAKFIVVSSNSSNSENQIHWSMAQFWTSVVPLWLLNILKKISVTCILTSISAIPLIGPTIVNQLISSRRARSYMSRYFVLNGMNQKASKDYEYEHLGLFFSFGMAAGVLEFLPVFSIVTMMSNIIGAARWSIDIIEKKRP